MTRTAPDCSTGAATTRRGRRDAQDRHRPARRARRSGRRQITARPCSWKHGEGTFDEALEALRDRSPVGRGGAAGWQACGGGTRDRRRGPASRHPVGECRERSPVAWRPLDAAAAVRRRPTLEIVAGMAGAIPRRRVGRMGAGRFGTRGRTLLLPGAPAGAAAERGALRAMSPQRRVGGYGDTRVDLATGDGRTNM